MKRLDRFSLIDRIGRELQSRISYTDIDVYLPAFGIDITGGQGPGHLVPRVRQVGRSSLLHPTQQYGCHSTTGAVPMPWSVASLAPDIVSTADAEYLLRLGRWRRGCLLRTFGFRLGPSRGALLLSGGARTRATWRRAT